MYNMGMFGIMPSLPLHWVTKFEIIAQWSPMCGILSILLILCEPSCQSSTNQING